jgi:MFS family permease
MKAEFYGWRLLAAFWAISIINLAFPMYGSSVMNPYMAADLHLDRRMLGLPYSVFVLMTGLPGPLFALIINRKGVRFTLTGGGLLVLAGSLAMALFVSSGFQAVAAFGIVVGSGVMAGGTTTAQVGVARWFVKRRALALAILYSANNFGGIVAAPLLDRIISASGGNWRMGWWLLAGLACFSTCIAVLFVKERPSDLGQSLDGGRQDTRAAAGKDAERGRFRVHVTSENWKYRDVLRSPAFWLMLASMLGASSAHSLFLGQGVAHLRDVGHSPAAAALSVSVMMVFSFLAKVIIGTFGDRYDPRYLWAATSASAGLSMLLLLNSGGALGIYPFAACLGFGFGGSIVCMMAVFSNYYGLAVFPSISGLGVAIQTTISAIVPYAAGSLFDSHGSYAAAFYVVGAWGLAGSIILLLVRPPRIASAAEPVSEAVSASHR